MFSKIEIAFKWIGILLIVTFLNELNTRFLVKSLSIQSNGVYHFFVPIEFSIYTIIFATFINLKRWNKILILLVFLLVIIEILNTLFLQPIYVTNTNTMIIESVFLVLLSLILYIRIKESTYYKNLLLEGVFWFNSSILFYYAFNILVWGFHNWDFINPPLIMYDINAFLCGLMYLTFLFSIYLNFIQVRKLKN